MKNVKKVLIGLSFLILLFFVRINIPENRKAIHSAHFHFSSIGTSEFAYTCQKMALSTT
jgi:hypothetical protein